LVTLNVVRPASSLIDAGSQPASVSLISTVLGPVLAGDEAVAVPDAAGLLAPPQLASSTTHGRTKKNLGDKNGLPR
jgi:hypothetical protein